MSISKIINQNDDQIDLQTKSISNQRCQSPRLSIKTMTKSIARLATKSISNQGFYLGSYGSCFYLGFLKDGVKTFSCRTFMVLWEFGQMMLLEKGVVLKW